VPYFYAAGKRVTLTVESSLWALDTEALGAAMIGDAIRQRILADAHRLRGKYVLAHVPSAALEPLRAARAVQVVYRSADAVLVALPEVRVEERRPEKLRRLRAWIESRRQQIEVSETEDGRLTLRPASGDAVEALEIANALQEEITPELAETRFIRTIESPDLKLKARIRPHRPD
jgi:urease accessory protein UreH